MNDQTDAPAHEEVSKFQLECDLSTILAPRRNNPIPKRIQNVNLIPKEKKIIGVVKPL